MNLAEIIEEVNRDIDDDLSTSEVLGWINRCMDDITPYAKYERMETITTQTDVNTYQLPSDLTKITLLVLNNEVLKEISLNDFHSPGYKRYADSIILQPTPTEEVTYSLYYEGKLPHLVQATDEPVIHSSFHDLFVLYTVARFMFQDDETYRKNDVFGEYNSRKRDFVQFMNKAKIQPIIDVYNVRWD